LPKSYAKRRRLHLDALALAAVNYRQNAAARFGFNDYDFVRIGRSTPDSAHLWHRFNRVENLDGKKSASALLGELDHRPVNSAPTHQRHRTPRKKRRQI